MEKRSDSSRLVMRILAILFCLTLLSLWMTANMYARYTTQSSGEDSARVARFCISEKDNLAKTYAVTLIPGKKEEIKVEIVNDSEVAVNYIFHFEMEGNAPLSIKMTKDTSDTAAEDGSADVLTKEADDNIWTVEKEAAGRTEDHYIAELSLSNAGYQYSGSVAMLTMTVKAEQID